MNYISLIDTPIGYMFDCIFRKYNIPLEISIIIFSNLEKKDLLNLYKKFNVCIELHCIFNQYILDTWINKKKDIENKKVCLINQINYLKQRNDVYSKIRLLLLIENYKECNVENRDINIFFQVREKFFNRIKKGKNSYIYRYYECKKLFNANSELITKRKILRIQSIYNYLEKNLRLINIYNSSKKSLIELLSSNGVNYYKSWNKSRLIKAYYQNV